MTTSLRKLLIANRGEIAVRIIRAAQALGITTVAACSDADTDSLAARMADEVQRIGPARADRSYLNVDALLKAARDSGADALHPGYGFLSENAAFAEAVNAAGLIFVGPQADTIRRMGDKAEARRTAAAAGVPVVPGSAGELEDLATALACADEIGYPLLIKASAGGGGRGIRMARDATELAREFPLAQAEAQAAFGSAAVYLERFIRRARHIEVQILGDGERAVHLFERECSLQRRRQKVLEEAPSPALTPAQRQALCDSAVRLAERLHYRGAGTLEYLFDDESGEFFFIEMNTRIQVEHPVTEMITGIDLVQAMLRIAGGEPLGLQQSDIRMQGAALEMRINAEDPERNFFPCPGTVAELQWPQGEGIRVESHLYAGYRIPPYYDSLLAKLVVHGKDRAQAIARAQAAVLATRITGMATTLSLHQWLLADARVQSARFDTGALETWLAERTDTRAKQLEEA
ncbi:acetyl-CoA carboxylase biotin carboxylase subunit [Herbaspirillum seropedicae]|uniref:biotin carboxylase n=1 Tax=Herbaspirillum seropedicae (strain SmR1) TaxID=757424 RepID=D8ITF3_HERSS|nr:acetyl-CoA carboxylase biotin carboxylase subunit [Herbaspirillum seropedicae]ADJ65583.1 acyl-CoA carboxylase biotin subunit protein [Herbaspirillum seropedicae SmR1]AKN67405.1 acetyl-CoA carboxylase [Herbaspirillum seropedicae]NQE31997.1 acetyl-CoA carboxylase [Herbaspirillum seropedicae]UMU23412.1 acetyl-CoA carboxylase biotin carboxylase subunit [Herbaspirillum seropedicae]